MSASFAVVIPTIGRPSLERLLSALDSGQGPRPEAVIVVDDRPGPDTPLPLPRNDLPLTVLHSGGRGPAAARNVGWRASDAEWICFLDDDVVTGDDWPAELAADLAAADASAVGIEARITVPAPVGRRATDDERRTHQLVASSWITADMAYRRSALLACSGFDERFPRAYREDADIALRMLRNGGRIVTGSRHTVHPVPDGIPSIMASVRAQIGNRDDALMRRKHGRQWRSLIGGRRGRLRVHIATTAAAVLTVGAAAARQRRLGIVAGASWFALTVDFAARRIAAGPRTIREIVTMLMSSVLIPPVAVTQRIRGELLFRRVRAEPPLAVLFDRDDTLIEDGPYLNDPDRVVPKADVRRALARLREHGLLLGVVTNQSGVAKGLISGQQLKAVNARVDEMLGPFDSWQVCVHDSDDGCRCRKPLPGMVLAAADALGVDTRRCVMIGDTGGDVAAAQAARAEAILVPTDRTRREEITDARMTAHVAATLDEAVSLVLKQVVS